MSLNLQINKLNYTFSICVFDDFVFQHWLSIKAVTRPPWIEHDRTNQERRFTFAKEKKKKKEKKQKKKKLLSRIWLNK